MQSLWKYRHMQSTFRALLFFFIGYGCHFNSFLYLPKKKQQQPKIINKSKRGRRGDVWGGGIKTSSRMRCNEMR